MAERHGRSTGPAGLLRTGLEAGSGLMAGHAVAILLSGKGMQPYPAAWAGALTGLALWLVIARHGTPRGARRGGTPLLWQGAAVVLLATFGMATGSIGFGSILAFALSLWAFGLAATSLSALFDTIDEGGDGAALQSVGQGLVGCYSGGIGLQSGHDRAPVLAVAMPHGNAAVVEHDHPGAVMPEPELLSERSRAVPGPDQLDIERLPGNWLEGSGAPPHFR